MYCKFNWDNQHFLDESRYDEKIVWIEKKIIEIIENDKDLSLAENIEVFFKGKYSVNLYGDIVYGFEKKLDLRQIYMIKKLKYLKEILLN